MGKICFRMVLYIQFQLFPISVVVANFLAPGTDRNEASQSTNLCQRSLQLKNEPLSLAFGVPPFGNVPKQHRYPLAERIHVKRKPSSVGSVVRFAETGGAR